MTTTPSSAEPIQKECRFAIHIPSKRGGTPDYHLVKEVLHFADGTTKPNVRYIQGYKRPFWVTKPQARNHEQKKEYERFENLTRYECTQSDLQNAVARALDRGWSNANLRQLASSPYLYGSDISSTALIKHQYRRQYPEAVSAYSICYFDIETDVLHGTNDPIISTMVFGKHLTIIVQASFVDGYTDPERRFRQKLHEMIPDELERFQFDVEYVLVPDAVTLIRETVKRWHEWLPDFVAIWNMDFDIPRFLDTLKKYNVDPKDIFSDPKLPAALRFCKYKKGSTKKITASGQVKPKNPSEQWHSLLCPAGFYIIDAMCSYRFIRQGAQEEASYSLDAILEKELKKTKLKIPGTEQYHNLELHEIEQSKYPFEYQVYACVDVIRMLELELTTNDLSQALPVRSGFSDFARYNSQTKRFADKYTFFLLDRECAIGTVAQVDKPEDVDVDDVDENEEDEETDEDEPPPCSENGDEPGDVALPRVEQRTDVLGLRDWIVTLKAHMSVLGMACILESPELKTLIRGLVYDSDAVGAYPSASMAANVSRETTVRELIDILGIDETMFRRQNINLLQGHVNALEYGCEMHGLPTPQQALTYFDDLV